MSKVCSRCGTSAQYKNGTCKECQRVRTALRAKRIAGTPCAKCGNTHRNKDGACKECCKATLAKHAAKKSAKPCVVCGHMEFFADGKCKTCTRKYRAEMGAKKISSGVPCSRCGSTYLYANGSCKACIKAATPKLAAEKTGIPCGICGVTKRYRTSGKCVACHTKRSIKWRRANGDVLAAARVRRRAAEIKATPAWANSFFIREAYALAALRTKMSGFAWHVDHIVPLRSRLVCGLHVESNLQVVPAVTNLTKSNRFWPHQS